MNPESILTIKHPIVLAAGVCGLVLAAPSGFSQGALTPPGPPAPTMKSLDQIEARTLISSVPFTITNPGSYYLVSNLNLTVNTNAITIVTNEVTLDLNGFTISTSVFRGSGDGILLNGGNTDITIFNGHITGGNFQYLGSGITYSGASPVNVHVSNVSVTECIANGIYLGTNSSTLVEACTLQTINVYGIEAGIVIHSAAQSGNTAIIANNTASDCVGTSVSGEGVLVNGTANNCYGSSYSGDGLDASDANNCSGTTGSGIYGLSANTLANNCSGISSSGTGLYALNANTCYGSSFSTGSGLPGLIAGSANYCSGYSESPAGYGLYTDGIAIGCSGNATGPDAVGLSVYIAIGCLGDAYGSGAVGLVAYIANSCRGSSFSYTYHYNMPP